MLIFLAGCATTDNFSRATAQKVAAEQTAVAVERVQIAERQVARALPDYPAWCHRRHASGALITDRLDVIALKSDRALGRANDQITACAEWYEEQRAGIAAKEGGK